jgi:hypothetical protein
MRWVSTKDHNCSSGRPQLEGGRLRRDGSQAMEWSAASVTEIRRCANPMIRLCGTTVNTSQARFTQPAVISPSAAAASHSITRAARASAATTATRSKPAASRPTCRSSTAGWSPSKTSYASPSGGRWWRLAKRRARPLITALTYASLAVIAQAYAAAGAEVFNIPQSPAPTAT